MDSKGDKKKSMVRYIKCPRCELNYIDAEKQEYCDVCIKEMSGIRTDAEELEAEEAEELPTELCPVCGENMMRAGEKMCEECRRRASLEEEPEEGSEDDDEWREYLDDDTDQIDEIEDIGETFDEEDIEEEEYHDEDEDLDYVTGDEIYTLTDDDDDEDEDADDEDF